MMLRNLRRFTWILCCFALVMTMWLTMWPKAYADIRPPSSAPRLQSPTNTIMLPSLLEMVDYTNICTAVKRYRKDGVWAYGDRKDLLFDAWTECTGIKSTYVVIASRAVEPFTRIEQASIMKVPLEGTLNEAYLFEFVGLTIGANVTSAIQVERENKADLPTSITSDPSSPSTPTPRFPSQLKAEVLSSTLNVRSGPGINYGALGTVRQGDQVTVLSKSDTRCSWLQIQHGTLNGWVSGGYVKADGCPAPSVRPTTTQACIPFKNHFNMAATITMTGAGREWTFYVQPKQTKTECFQSGDHTWSISVGDYRMNGGGYIAPGYYEVVNIYREF